MHRPGTTVGTYHVAPLPIPNMKIQHRNFCSMRNLSAALIPESLSFFHAITCRVKNYLKASRRPELRQYGIPCGRGQLMSARSGHAANVTKLVQVHFVASPHLNNKGEPVMPHTHWRTHRGRVPIRFFDGFHVLRLQKPRFAPKKKWAPRATTSRDTTSKALFQTSCKRMTLSPVMWAKAQLNTWDVDTVLEN